MITKRLAALSAALVALGATVFATIAVTGAANAQSDRGPVILIVNQAALLANSKAGQDIARQIGDLQKIVNSEVRAEVESITKESTELQEQRNLLSEEVLQERVRALAVRERSFPALREIKLRELQMSEQKALGEIGKELQPILQKLVEDRGATLLLDRSAVMFASADNDITADVMAALDKKLQTVKVDRVVLQRGEGGENNE